VYFTPIFIIWLLRSRDKGSGLLGRHAATLLSLNNALNFISTPFIAFMTYCQGSRLYFTCPNPSPPAIDRSLAVYSVVNQTFLSFLFESVGVTAIERHFLVFPSECLETGYSHFFRSFTKPIFRLHNCPWRSCSWCNVVEHAVRQFFN